MQYLFAITLILLSFALESHAMEQKKDETNTKSKKTTGIKLRLSRLDVEREKPRQETPNKRPSPNTDAELKKQELPLEVKRRDSSSPRSPRTSEGRKKRSNSLDLV